MSRDIRRGGLGSSGCTNADAGKGGELTQERKGSNRAFSSERVKVEHGIGGMERFGIASQRWRNPRRTHTIIMKNVAGLATGLFNA